MAGVWVEHMTSGKKSKIDQIGRDVRCFKYGLLYLCLW